MNTHYKVYWEIDIFADSPEAAAEVALMAQRDSSSTCTYFTVYDVRTGTSIDVDLNTSGE
jgi:hypothetical protein